MPYEFSPLIKTPPDDTIIWRYMDLPKFLLMLEQRALFFSSIYQLEDRWEAVIPKAMVDLIATNAPSASGRWLDSAHSVMEVHKVNCWYQGETESVAMWSLYTSSAFGVAIQSTVGNLKASLKATNRGVLLGAVKYEDHGAVRSTTDTLSEIDPVQPLLQKRVCFKHECELRAIADALPKLPLDTATTHYELNRKEGLLVSVDLEVLIVKVTLSPRFPDWAVDLIKTALHRAELRTQFARSSIDRAPEAFYVR